MVTYVPRSFTQVPLVQIPSPSCRLPVWLGHSAAAYLLWMI